jgi:spore germination cell wall hydrolase CwlJ-like protein
MQKLDVVLTQHQSKKRRNITLKTILSLAFVGLLLYSKPATAQVYGFNSYTAQLTTVQPMQPNPNAVKELICMSLNIYHEARGTSQANQFGVAHVTKNRQRQRKLSICDVVFERKGHQPQFSWTNKPGAKQKRLEIESWDRAQEIAYSVLYTKTHDITKGATYFHERNIRPVWASKAREKTTIGAHVFIRLEEVAESRQVVLP